MTVLVANDTPPAIRGILKRWFVEPKPNVFVGTVNRRTRDKVLDYVKRNAKGMSLLILSSEPNCQGFKIERWNEPNRRDAYLSGLWLVFEHWGGGSAAAAALPISSWVLPTRVGMVRRLGSTVWLGKGSPHFQVSKLTNRD